MTLLRKTGRGCVRYPDLGASVHRDEVPDELVRELPERYSSCFSVAEYFSLYDHPHAICACELDEPRHVILFTVDGGTADILNKVIDIEPASVDRVARAVFRAFPRVRRVRGEIKFPPEQLPLAHRVRFRLDDLVVDLPGTVEEYRAGLGRRTRQNLNQYGNRLRRAHPEFEVAVIPGAEITRELLDQVVGWNAARLHDKGELSLYERDPRKLVPLLQLLQAHGIGVCGYLDGRLAAAQFVLHVGDDTWVHTVGFDPAYEDLHLGLLMTERTIAESIARGCRRVHLLWGTPVYKKRLGAQPVPAWQVSVFRTELGRLLYWREKWTRAELQRAYWRLRHGVKRRLLRRPEQAGAGAGDGA